MKNKLITIIIVLIILAPVYTAYAGKPTPPPYPGPGMEAQAYPAPAQPLPTPTPLPVLPEPVLTAADCPTFPISKPCAYGIVFDGYGWRVWVAYPGLDLFRTDGFVTLYGQGGGVKQYSLYGRTYNSNNDITWYATGHVYGCGSWYIGSAVFATALNGQPWWADIRLPNNYFWWCTYLTLIEV